jgi:hypothetical protein
MFIYRSYPAPGISEDQLKFDPTLDISVEEMLSFIANSSRVPESRESSTTEQYGLNNNVPDKNKDQMMDCKPTGLADWRRFISDFDLISKAREAPNNFMRELKHLDLTHCREVHKIGNTFCFSFVS